jgi:endo-1,4-beta-mannosidase
MSVKDLISYSEEIGLYPITLEEFAASESFYRLHRFENCPLTFIYNTVTCSVAIYDGKETGSLILEVHDINGLRYLQKDLYNLVNFVLETHQGV